jgi:hypothetical protein
MGLITYLGMSAVVKIEATGIRLFLAVAVLGVSFGAVSLLERRLRHGEPADEGWPSRKCVGQRRPATKSGFIIDLTEPGACVPPGPR